MGNSEDVLAGISAAATHPAAAVPGHRERADWRGASDERRTAGIAGPAGGTNGKSLLWVCILLVVSAFALCSVNALSIADDAARSGLRIEWWAPWATEYTSFAGFIAALPVVVLAERWAASVSPLARRAAVVAAGSVVFCLLHLAVMVALRHLLWLLLDRHYRFDVAGEWLYEYRKDLVTFGLALGAVAVARRWPASRDARQPPSGSSVSLADGRRAMLVRPDSLLAVCSAGNYVELLFEDGKRRLIRTTLANVELALEAHGFARTHKQWLARLACVKELKPTGAGDYRLRLAGDLEVPLSRRNAALVRSLRQAMATPAEPAAAA